MTGILNYAFSNPALPFDRKFVASILALPGFHRWFQANPNLVTLNGANVATWTEKSGSGAVLTQGTAGQQAPLVNGQFGTYPGVDFDGLDDEYLLSPTAVNTNNDFTWVEIFRAAATGSSQQMLSNYVSTNVGTFLGIDTTGHAKLQHGTGIATDTKVMANAPAIAIGGNSGGVTKLRVNGGATISAASNNDGSTSTLRVGRLNSGGSQPFGGIVSDIILIQGVNLFDTNVENLQLLEKYAARYASVALVA